MFGHSRSIAFDPYRRRRSRWRLPRSLVLLLLGSAAGAAGLYVVQERYLPPRLSAADSAELRSAYEAADTARTRLSAELAESARRLGAAVTQAQKATGELAASRSTVESMRTDLAVLVASLPPDPRGGAVQIRAARFTLKGVTLSYDLVLTRERAGSRALDAALQLTVAGLSARGAPASFAAPAGRVSIAGHEIARGQVVLPEGFRPDQVTVQVLDRIGGKALGTRVLRVN